MGLGGTWKLEQIDKINGTTIGDLHGHRMGTAEVILVCTMI